MSEIDRATWNGLVGDGSPFLEWDLLEAFETTECATPESGWFPMHVLLEDESQNVIAACPCYLKGNSAGEFVFDHEWAYAAERVGVSYYPKMLIAVPFSPVVGNRLLTAPGQNRPKLSAVLARGVRQLIEDTGASGAHWLFTTPKESALLVAQGYEERQGIQYHWHNRGYADFDDWLSGFKSKRRKTMRRERREIAASDIEIEVMEGDSLDEEAMDVAFELYLTTIDKKVWGRQYLRRPFFQRLLDKYKHRLLLIVARRAGQVLAGSFFIHKNGELFGRYWGCFEDVPFLHFEVSYYRPVELCIERGWSRFDAGAQGSHKYDRGFDPIITHSAHWLADPRLDGAVRHFLRRERRMVEHEIVHMRTRSPCRRVQVESPPRKGPRPPESDG